VLITLDNNPINQLDASTAATIHRTAFFADDEDVMAAAREYLALPSETPRVS